VSYEEIWAVTSENGRRLFEELTSVPTRKNSVKFIATYSGFEGESQLLMDLWKMRIPRATNPDGQNGMVFQTFQDAHDSFAGGRSMWMGILNGRLYLINRFVEGNNDCQTCGVDLGPIPYDQWVDYSLSVYLSANPSLGRMDLSINGNPAGTILGQTVFSETEVTRMHFQLVSFNGTTSSTADYDDGQISTPPGRRYHLDK